MYKNYSVLMSVYCKENPEYLRDSMISIYEQTLPTNDFVLVCDGPLNNALDQVIEDMQHVFGNTLHVYRLEENRGLGEALNYGLHQCKNELVARMDSDDMSLKDRCEKELQVFNSNNKIAIVSGGIEEFIDSPKNITGKRVVPKTTVEIINFSKKRNPFNHPAVMLRKSIALEVGGYSEKFHLFEDYYLWIRILMCQYQGINLQDTLVYMRTSANSYERRGGVDYAKDLLRFHKWMLDKKWSSASDFLLAAVPHAFVCIAPNFLRRIIYGRIR